MFSVRNLQFFVLLTALIAGCAARQPPPPPYQPPLTPPKPEFKEIPAYHRPQDSQGQVCVIQCQTQKNSCNTLCRMENDSCIRNAKDEARFLYEDAKEKFRQQDAYERSRYGEPLDPSRAPSLVQFLDTSPCDKDCGCENEYDTCFEACGGTITRSRRCMKNCDQVKKEGGLIDSLEVHPSLGIYEISATAPLRRQPAVDAEIMTILSPGTKIHVVRTAGEYLEVHSAKGNTPGYVLQEQTTFSAGR